MDHTAPVLNIIGADGKLRAVLFGYACHNTTLTAEIYQLSGDYAGFAAAELERRHPGATALFLMLCGADQNPNPRGTVELARKYGDALAAEVDRVIAARMKPVAGPIRTAFRLTTLQLAPRTRPGLRNGTEEQPCRAGSPGADDAEGCWTPEMSSTGSTTPCRRFGSATA